MEKAIGYIRVSTIDQDVKGAGAEAQLATIEKWAQLNDIELVHVYKDVISGAKASRPGLDKLLDVALNGGPKKIACAYLSRLGRSSLDTQKTVAKLDKAGVAVTFIKEGITTGTGPAATMFMQLLAALAEYEREVIRERIMGGKATKELAGTFYNGTRPFGYVFTKQNFEFTEHSPEYVATLPAKKRPEYAERDIYLKIVSMYLDERMALDKIADIIRGEGVDRISATSVRNMLGNPIYYTGKIERTSIAGGKKLTYTLPPLIKASRWHKIEQRLDANKHKAKRGNPDPTFWLRDVLRCELCGDALKPKKVKSGGKVLRYYSCTSKNQSKALLSLRGRERCKLPNIPADDIERTLWGKVTSKLTWWDDTRKELADNLTDSQQWIKKVREHKMAANGYRAQIAKAQRNKEQLFTMLDEELTEQRKAEFMERLDVYDNDITRLEAMATEQEEQLAQAQEAHANAETWQRLLTESPELLEQLAHEVELLAPEHRKIIIEGMARGPITVDGESSTGGRPAQWYAHTYIDATQLAALERIAADGALPVLTTANRKQLGLIRRLFLLAA